MSYLSPDVKLAMNRGAWGTQHETGTVMILVGID